MVVKEKTCTKQLWIYPWAVGAGQPMVFASNGTTFQVTSYLDWFMVSYPRDCEFVSERNCFWYWELLAMHGTTHTVSIFFVSQLERRTLLWSTYSLLTLTQKILDFLLHFSLTFWISGHVNQNPHQCQSGCGCSSCKMKWKDQQVSFIQMCPSFSLWQSDHMTTNLNKPVRCFVCAKCFCNGFV